MADVTVKIITPADSFALISLEELKLALGLGSGVSADDPQLQFLIDTNSAIISTLANRIFAREEVIETWRDLSSRRLYLTHWPVLESDIESVTTNGEVRTDYELEEGSGKLSIFTARTEDIVVHYTGGFNLPGDAPDALKQAAALLVNTSKAEQAAAALTGVRMIAHKESRVMFHSPTAGSSSGGTSSTQARETVKALLDRFTRQWI